ncbi:MAG: hypothetical protein ACM31D_10165 [Bacteroidota bacterium]
MVIWQGLGILIPFVVVLMTQGLVALAEKLGGPGAYNANPLWGVAAMGLSALVVTALGIYLRRRGARVVVDKETGQELVLRSRHTLFFIPMEYWGAILVVGGIAFKLVK